MKFILILLALMAGGAKADSFGLHLGTAHFGEQKCDYGINPGAYYASDSGLLVGAYRNSCERLSLYAGYRTEEWNRIRVMAVGATGYGRAVKVAVMPSIRVYGPWHVSGGVIGGKGLLHVSTEWRF